MELLGKFISQLPHLFFIQRRKPSPAFLSQSFHTQDGVYTALSRAVVLRRISAYAFPHAECTNHSLPQ